MKKKLFVFLIVFFLIIVSLTQFGFDIGGVRIGKQVDLMTPQKTGFNESLFFHKYYSNEDLTVLNLWATWCVPCVEEMPTLNEIKKKYSGKNVHFISMSVDNDSVKLVNFLSKNKFDFKDITLSNLPYRNSILNTLESRPVDTWIKSHIVPVTYLIKNKKIVGKIEGQIEAADLINQIEKNK